MGGEEAKRTRGKAEKPGSRVGSRSSKEDTGKRALLCKPSRDVDSRKPRALLCKPSRDVDSRKLILAVTLDQGPAKKTQEKEHCMQIGRIYTETESQACKV